VKVLVTGGTGYIGSHTVVELQNNGFEVVVIDNLSNSFDSVITNIGKITGKPPEFAKIDLTDQTETLNFFDKHQEIAGVIHFAAFKSVSESVKHPLKYYNNNLKSLVNLMMGMAQSGVRNLVFSSSCTVYGQPDELPVTENAPIKQAWSPYGHTKQISEEIIQNVVKNEGNNGTLLRYFNPIGAHESALIGELPIGVPDNLIPYITQTAIGLRKQLMVYGSDYPTPDGTAVRDYIHVMDLAKAHVKALNRMIKNEMAEPVEIFNLGTGRGYSVLEIIRSFEKVAGQPLNYSFAERRPGDIERVWADNTLAREVLKWKATLDLDNMIATAWKWQQAITKEVNHNPQP